MSEGPRPPPATAGARRGGRGAVRRQDDGRLERGRRTRERLRRASRELMLEQGFDGATLRAIAERAGMAASSIYRHVRSKEELLVWELAGLQDEAWTRFRRQDSRAEPTRERVRKFFQFQHELLARDADYTAIALRATTWPGERVASQVLALHDRTIGLLAEILQAGRRRADLAPGLDVLAAARALLHVSTGARIDWANGRLDEPGCRRAIESSVELLFRGIGAGPGGAPALPPGPPRARPAP
jgi:AcrR family transcriptional regulator